MNENDRVIMPARLTAENGAKTIFNGEFYENETVACGYEACTPDDCPVCGGSGEVTIKVPVSWTTIKAIYKLAVERFGESIIS